MVSNINFYKYSDYETQIKNINKLNDLFKNQYLANELFIKKYEEFLNSYNKHFNQIFETIIQQIYRLLLLLINIGLYYGDFKLDNFAFNYSDSNEHLGIKWSNNKLINGKYLNVSIIDWDSGLLNYSMNNSFPEIKRFSKYGQYYINVLKENNLNNYNKENNVLRLDPILLNFLEKEYKLEINELSNMTTLDDFNNYTQKGNEVIFTLNLNLTKIYMQKLLLEYSIENIKQNKFYIEQKPIIDGDDKKYLIKCINQKLKIILSYFLLQGDEIYLVIYNKITKKSFGYKLTQDIFGSNWELFEHIKKFCTT
jgi:hypothetical protein